VLYGRIGIMLQYLSHLTMEKRSVPKPDDNPDTKCLIEEETAFLTLVKAIVAAIVLAVSFEAGARTLIPEGTLFRFCVSADVWTHL
jgi:hypothetical protein